MVLPLLGCEDLNRTTPAPDQTIKIAPSLDGKHSLAIPPECPNWRTADLSPFENQPLPQFGCANARNLAAMVDRPEDLVSGRDSGDANGAVAAAGMQLYLQGKTAAFIDPNATSPTAQTATRAGTNGTAGSAGSP
jgi:hypothetical protein